MINVRLDLYGVDNTVVRPVSVMMVDRFKKIIGMTKDIPTKYDGNDTVYRTMNKTGSVTGKNTIYPEELEVMYTDDLVEGNELALNHLRPDMIPFYVDKDIRSKFTPMYLRRKVNMEIKYYTKSEAKAISITNRLRVYTSTEEQYGRQDIEYSYSLPSLPCELLKDINILKNNVDIPKLDLEDYLINTFDSRLILTYSEDGRLDKTNITIREAQCDIQAYIVDDISNIKHEYDDNKNMYFITVNFEYQYEKPIAIWMKYPILIYNQLLDSRYYNFIDDYSKPNPNVVRPYSINGLNTMRNRVTDLLDPKNNYYLTIPSIDKETLPDPNTACVRLVSVLIFVEDDRRFLFNLYKMSEQLRFKPCVIDTLISEGEFVGEFRHSLFYIELYKNSIIDPTNKVKILNNGDVVTTEDMDIRATYRVVFNIVGMLTVLTDKSKRRVKEYISNKCQIGDYNFTEAYVTVLNIPQNNVNAAINASASPGDVIFKLTDIIPRHFKTKQISAIYAGMLEEIKDGRS